MRVIYIAGPFRGASAWAVHQNIERAEALAYQVWEAGFVALCPHNNTRHFDGTLTDEVWLKGDLELLSRCDAVLTVPGWQSSRGTVAEVEYAQQLGLPVFETLNEL